mmetsp:Transcript_5582/g.25151  ORF Transcript_5582/g.25151 Transcript_5582/m.25151 type:complete len:251 (-) Transcript_5582:112-864(-)
MVAPVVAAGFRRRPPPRYAQRRSDFRVGGHLEVTPVPFHRAHPHGGILAALGEAYHDVRVQVRALPADDPAFVHGLRGHLDVEIAVARRALIALAFQPQRGAAGNAGRDGHRRGAVLRDQATVVLARVAVDERLRQPPFTVAGWTDQSPRVRDLRLSAQHRLFQRASYVGVDVLSRGLARLAIHRLLGAHDLLIPPSLGTRGGVVGRLLDAVAHRVGALLGLLGVPGERVLDRSRYSRVGDLGRGASRFF